MSREDPGLWGAIALLLLMKVQGKWRREGPEPWIAITLLLLLIETIIIIRKMEEGGSGALWSNFLLILLFPSHLRCACLFR